MNKKISLSLFATGVFTCSQILAQSSIYPETKKVDQKDVYFGDTIADPYRWLEDDKSAEAADWVKQENKVTEDYLAQIPYRKKLKERLTKIWNFPKYTVPFKKGEELYFYTKNDGIQNQNVVYSSKGIGGKEVELIDPNKLSTDGTVSLSMFSVSRDAKYMAYATSKAGSDWETINILDVEAKKTIADKLEWVKFSAISWKGDGFYYSRYDAPSKEEALTKKNEFHKVYFHKIGTEQSADVLTFDDKEHNLRNFTTQTTDDERYLIIYATETSTGNALYVKDLNKKEKEKGGEWIKIIESFDNEYQVIDVIGSSLLVQTNNKAPKYKIVAINLERIEPEKWKTIIPEKEEEVLQGAVVSGGKLITRYMKDATSRLYVNSISGAQEAEIALPAIGTVDDMRGTRDNANFLYSYSSFTVPPTIYKYEVGKAGKSSVLYNVKLDFKADNFETEQIFYTSKDGTKIPMFLVHKKGIEFDATTPTLLFGYGGFNISKTPEFKAERLIFLEQGGMFAMPCIRGGGEYGEEWHKAGTKLNKQNVFDDFIAAAEFLIKENYTSSAVLAISGRSNGGLLVGACMTQRPDLFKVAIPIVGVMDMLRFQKFTIGWSWVGDYGSSDDSLQYQALIKYSPLHNIEEGKPYPATLICTGDHDDRVVPAHSFKFAATLQEKYKGENPTLIRIDSNAGHGSGKPTSKLIDEQADIFSFIMYSIGMEPKYK
jgi:prolyl oligopeptidase